MTVQSEGATPYRVRRAEDEDLIRQALAILDARLRTQDDVHVTSPEDTRRFLRLQLAEREAEVFCVLFLTNRHRVIAPMDGEARTVATPPKVRSQDLYLSFENIIRVVYVLVGDGTPCSLRRR